MNIMIRLDMIKFLILALLVTLNTFAQGVYNNGANIIFAGASQMYIDGVGAGNYLSAAATSGSITSSTTSSITLLGNWTNNSTNNGFAATDGGGVVFAGNAQNIGGTSATAFNNVNLTGNGVKTLAVQSTTIGGQTTFPGILSVGTSTLDLNSNTLRVTNSALGAITSAATGYILSETNTATNPSIIRWYTRTTSGAYVFPFGVAGSKIPFTFNISVPMAGAADYVDVSTRGTAASDNLPWETTVTNMFSPNTVPTTSLSNGSAEVVVDRWWQINPSSAVTSALTFAYRGIENTLIVPYNTGNIGAQYWNGSQWQPNNSTLGSALIVSGATIGFETTPAVTAFGPWVLSAVLHPLPIELLSVNVSCVNNDAVLEWCTATEQNNHHFTIEHSMDAINYTVIGTEAGNGTSTSKHCYKYITNSTIGEINYYRLSQTDNNGKTSILKTLALESCGNTNNTMVLTNTGTKQVGVLINSTEETSVELFVHNSLGQILEIKPLEIKKGYNTLLVDLNNVSNSIYYICVYKGNTLKASKKIIVSDLGN